MTNKKEGFLPKDYVPNSASEFMKLTEGDNEMRILSTPLIGKLWWVSPEGLVREKGGVQKGDKPYRIEYTTQLPKDVADCQTKEFWMLKVWDYSAKSIKILEITQQSILQSLHEFISNSKWGDPREYDVNIKREGSGMETKYFVMPSPHTMIAPEIKDANDNSKVELSSFLTPIDNSDPFEGMDVEDKKEQELEKDLPF